MAEWNLCPNCGQQLRQVSSPSHLQPTTQQPTIAINVTSQSARNIAIALVVVIVFGGVFFLAPVVPYQQCSLFVCASATVSPSYAIFQCGMVLNPTVLGYQSSGVRWVC